MDSYSDTIMRAELSVLAQPTNVQYCLVLASLYQQSSSWKQVSDIFGSKNKQEILLANAFFNAAFVSKQKGDFQLAIDCYMFSIDFDVEQPEEIYVNLAVIYSENLRMENKAISMLKRALSLKNDFTPALYNLAGLYEESGDRDSAIDCYQRILILYPLDPDVLSRLAVCLHRGESSELIAPLKEAIRLTNVDTEQKINLNYALGKVLDDSEYYTQAFNTYKEANRLDCMGGREYSPEKHELYIDENIEFFNNDWFTGLPVISTAAPIFICGMFRSGSTLLEQVLSAHTQITAGGEIDFFDHFLNQGNFTYPNSLKKQPKEFLASIANSYLDKINKTFPNANLLTDKRPDNFLYIGLIKSLFPNAQIIHTQRNLMDNCLAIYFQRLDSKLTYATNLLHIKHYYLQQQRLMQHWKHLFSDSVHVVSYEELVDNPEKSTKDIFSRLNLHWQKQCHEFYINKNSVKTASIWQVRQPLHKGSCNRWLNYETELTCVLKN